jgi:hypothetical protein
VAFDLRSHTVKWSQHLDLTTDQISYRHAHSLLSEHSLVLLSSGMDVALYTHDRVLQDRLCR